MNETNSLVIFTEAAAMLAKADTIQKAKELKDLALTAADWARRKNMGEVAINYCQSYAWEAERKMGEMLIQTERHPPGPDKQDRSHDVSDLPPMIKELGLTWRDSTEAQTLASIPRETFDELKAGKINRADIHKEIQKRKREEYKQTIAKKGKNVPDNEKWSVEIGDIKTYKTDKQFDFIITDPPYPFEYLNLYEILAERANEWLMPGGMLVAMCGQSYLNQLFEIMSEHLEYYWTGCYLTPGQPTPLRTRQVNTTWKPILFFIKKDEKYKGKIFGDVFKSDLSDKTLHEWGQSESGMFSIISSVCLPGQSIFDPFCGTGTTGIAAIKHGCLFHGIDIEKENVNLSKGRINDYTKKR